MSSEQSAGGAKIRLFTEAGLAAGGELRLDQGQARYVRQVMRLVPGDGLLLFNGRDGEWRAEITRSDRRAVVVRLGAREREQAAGPDLWLLCAPVKRGPFDLIVQKATELGAAALWPVMTERCNSSRVRQARLRAIAIEAAEQCGRLDVPEIHPAQKLSALLAGWPAERRLMLCDTDGAPPARAALAASSKETSPKAAILIGPEGGFSPAERTRLAGLPFATRLGLGPRTLRAETAAIAALALWQAWLGDWTK